VRNEFLSDRDEGIFPAGGGFGTYGFRPDGRFVRREDNQEYEQDDACPEDSRRENKEARKNDGKDATESENSYKNG